MEVIKRGIKNAFRNSIRTVSIVFILGLSIGLTLTMLIARNAVDEKIASVKTSIGNTITISPAGVRGFEGGGEPLTSAQIDKVNEIKNVTGTIQSLNNRLTTDNSSLVSAIDAGSLGQRFNQTGGGQPPSDTPTEGTTSTSTTRSFTPPVMILGTNNPTNLSQSIGGGDFKLTSGEVFNGDETENISIIGKDLAEKNSLVLGSTFTAYDKDIKVVGIYDSGNSFSNNQVIVPLISLQTLTEQTGEISSAIVTVASISDIDEVVTEAKNVLGDSVDITNGADQAKTAIEPLENIKSISTISLIGSMIAGAVIILLTMMMIVRERRREIGVLKAIGATNIRVMAQFIVESITLTSMGMIIGTFIGFLGASPITKLLVQNSSSSTTQAPQQAGRGMGRIMEMGTTNIKNIQVNVGPDIILYAILAAFIIAIVGSAIPAYFISKVRPAEVMRAE